MITAFDQDRVARAVLTYLAEPGDPVLAALLQVSASTIYRKLATWESVPGDAPTAKETPAAPIHA